LLQVRPNELALGSSDQYVRIYDRRKTGLGPALPPAHAFWSVESCHAPVTDADMVFAICSAGRSQSWAAHADPLLKLAPPHLCIGKPCSPLKRVLEKGCWESAVQGLN
jgi:hypothetical protein